MHKHEGYLSISNSSLHFYDNDINLLFSLNKGSIKELGVTYEGVFKRFRDSRGFNPPLKITLKNKEMYLFTKTIGKRGLRGDKMFRGNNKFIEIWCKSPLSD